MLADKVWLTVGVPVHPRGVGWGWGGVGDEFGALCHPAELFQAKVGGKNVFILMELRKCQTVATQLDAH